MHRFYCPDADLFSETITITDKEELHHLRNVLRLKARAEVFLFNGRGQEAAGILLEVTPKRARVEVLSSQEAQRGKPLIILACALPKKSKFEFIIEKATELGVDEIIPLKTTRTEINLIGDRLHKKHLRYHTVAINASKQSKRSIVPTVHPVSDFSSVLDHLTKTTAAIIPSLSGDRKSLVSTFKDLKSPAAISFLIGPEGDFTPEEYAQAGKKGCLPVSLGETVLKVETAAICALSCANLFFRV